MIFSKVVPRLYKGTRAKAQGIGSGGLGSVALRVQLSLRETRIGFLGNKIKRGIRPMRLPDGKIKSGI